MHCFVSFINSCCHLGCRDEQQQGPVQINTRLLIVPICSWSRLFDKWHGPYILTGVHCTAQTMLAQWSSITGSQESRQNISFVIQTHREMVAFKLQIMNFQQELEGRDGGWEGPGLCVFYGLSFWKEPGLNLALSGQQEGIHSSGRAAAATVTGLQVEKLLVSLAFNGPLRDSPCNQRGSKGLEKQRIELH